MTAQHCTNVGREAGHPYPPADLKVHFDFPVHGGSGPGDGGGPMVFWDDDGPLLQTVTAGAADRTTCGEPSLESHPESWVGIYNRVDRSSSAGSFLVSHVPGL